MKRYTPIIALALLLAGCGLTSEGNAIRAAVRETGKTVADAELGNIVWGLCNGVSVGAIKRRYGGKPEKAAAWQSLCDSQSRHVVFSAEDAP